MSAVPEARRPLESGFQTMPPWALGDLLEDEVVGVDEVAEDEVGGEQAAVHHPAELGALFALVDGGLDVVGLVAEVELFHHGGFHDRLLVGVVEGGHAAEHDGEEAGVGRLRVRSSRGML